MRNSSLALVAMVALSACEAPAPANPGMPMHDFFPFDGLRTWEYLSDDAEVGHKLIGTMRASEPEPVGGINTYFIDYRTECLTNDPSCVDGELVRSVQWGNDRVKGAFIFSWSDGDQEFVFDPPVKFTNEKMNRDDSATTQSSGFTWTSTLLGFEECPVQMNVDWADCARFALEMDPPGPAGEGIVGDYWAIGGMNLVAIDLEGDVGRWELRRHECTPASECRGEW